MIEVLLLNKHLTKVFMSVIGILKFLAMGNWGSDDLDDRNMQRKIAIAMAIWCGSQPCDLIVDTGDNFYPAGVQSSDDYAFSTLWDSMYSLPNIVGLSWLISVGDYDHDISVPGDTREYYQVLYSFDI